VLIFVEFSNWNGWHFETLDPATNEEEHTDSVFRVDPENGGTTFFRNVPLQYHTVSQPEYYRQFEHSWLAILENIKKVKLST
jgi:hypothetical protein